MTEPVLTLIRHGETEWSREGRHTSRTELDLTDAGDAQSRRVGEALAGRDCDLVLCSPRVRARRTAERAGLDPVTIDDDLTEWEYGELEGLTIGQIQERFPGWSIWTGPWPGGETSDDVARRADRVLARILASGAQQVALVGHGHMSRVLAARWLGGPADMGAWLELDTASWSDLGWSRGARTLHHWNVPTPG